jgi:hypothetical protein
MQMLSEHWIAHIFRQPLMHPIAAMSIFILGCFGLELPEAWSSWSLGQELFQSCMLLQNPFSSAH